MRRGQGRAEEALRQGPGPGCSRSRGLIPVRRFNPGAPISGAPGSFWARFPVPPAPPEELIMPIDVFKVRSQKRRDRAQQLDQRANSERGNAQKAWDGASQ